MSAERVLVLGGRTAIALHIGRALQRAGCTVVAADSMATSITRFSRSISRFVHVPRPGRDPLAFADAVADVVRRHDIDRIIPTGEERLWLAFAAARGRTQRVLVVGDMPIGTLAALHDKAAFQQLVRDAGLTPTPTVPATAAALAGLLLDGERVVVKPRGQRFGRGVAIVDRQTPPAAWPLDDDAVAQPCVEGEERCGFVLAEHGRVVAAVCYLPRWRFERGPSFGFEPIVDEPFVTAMTQLVQAHGLHGAFGFDAIARDDGSLAFLECNPRCTSGLHLIDDAGLQAAFLGCHAPAAPPSEVGAPRMVAPAMVLFGWRQPGPFWRDFWRSTDVVWDWRDPLPSLAFVAVVAELALVARREGIPARFATSHQIAWDPAAWPLAGLDPGASAASS